MKIKVDHSLDTMSSCQDENIMFKVEASPAMFDILTSKLYSNVIESMIREIISNAHDSHVAANNVETPIEVHIPSDIEPYLEVRDFGVSLSHEEMINVYTVFFKSSKNDTDAQIGGFGLGAKLPFAYTEQFTITTFSGSEKTEYLACKEGGVPALKVMYSVKDDSPRGLSVRIPVQPSDISEIKDSLKSFIKFSTFNVKFDKENFAKVAEVDEELTELFQQANKRVTVYKNYEEYCHGLLIRLGGVLYYHYPDIYSGKAVKLDPKWEDKLDSDFISPKYIAPNSHGFAFVYDYEVGEIQPTASREALQMSEEQEWDLIQEVVFTRSKVCELLEKELNKTFNKKEKITEETRKSVIQFCQKYGSIMDNLHWAPSLQGVEVFNQPISHTKVIVSPTDIIKDRDDIVNARVIRTHEYNVSDFIRYFEVQFSGQKSLVLVSKERISDIRNSNLSRSLPADTQVLIFQLKKKADAKAFIQKLKDCDSLACEMLLDIRETPNNFQSYNERVARRHTTARKIEDLKFSTEQLEIIKKYGYIPLIGKGDDYDIQAAFRAVNIPVVDCCSSVREYKRYLKSPQVKPVTECLEMLKPFLRDSMLAYAYNSMFDNHASRQMAKLTPNYLPKFAQVIASRYKELEKMTNLSMYLLPKVARVFGKTSYELSNKFKDKFKDSLSLEGKFFLHALNSYSMDEFFEEHAGTELSFNFTIPDIE